MKWIINSLIYKYIIKIKLNIYNTKLLYIFISITLNNSSVMKIIYLIFYKSQILNLFISCFALSNISFPGGQTQFFFSKIIKNI